MNYELFCVVYNFHLFVVYLIPPLSFHLTHIMYGKWITILFTFCSILQIVNSNEAKMAKKGTFNQTREPQKATSEPKEDENYPMRNRVYNNRIL